MPTKRTSRHSQNRTVGKSGSKLRRWMTRKLGAFMLRKSFFTKV